MIPYKNIKHVGIIVLISAITVAIYFPTRHARHYICQDINQIIENLWFQKESQQSLLKNCNYHEIISALNLDIEIKHITDEKSYSLPESGGEYKPNNCNPLLKSAIIVPYRNRPDQLTLFLKYMHNYLQKQKLHYRIFIVDQKNHHPFNRAKLLNIGAKFAMEKNYSCLILHDLDLIPLNYANIYGCSHSPRHMSSSLDTFRYNLPYLTIVGGAVAIRSSQFKEVNGMSNSFEGWGGEDDDFYLRLKSHGFKLSRFCPSISKYTMLRHSKNKEISENRFNLLKESGERNHFDGLNTLNDNFSVALEQLFTHILVP